MPRYAKLGKQMVSGLNLGGRAFDVAQENYAKYSKLNFWEDLLYYLREGYVVARPNFFVMAKPIERNGKRGWFVQMLVGDLGELLTVIPCKLDFVAFCRNNDDNMRIVEWDYMVQKVGEMYGFTEQKTT